MRDVSTTGGYVPFSIFIKIFTGVLNLRIFNNVLKMGDINYAN